MTDLIDEVDEVEDELDELSKEFVEQLIDKMMLFMDVLVGHSLHAYQKPLARRVIESVIINDGEEITATAARQSGKTEIIANVVALLMVLLPRLAKIYPDLLGRFKDGFMVGMFAPVEGQVETIFGRTVDRLSSPYALTILEDPEINDKAVKIPGVVRTVRLKSCGSFVSMMTCNPRAKIESKTFHLVIIDEAQEADDMMVDKSIVPMLAYHAGTMVKTGSASLVKNNYYRSIQVNKRRQTMPKAKKNHFEWDWKVVVKYNKEYGKFIAKQKLRLGEDSDSFQMSFCCKWMLERGMFVTEKRMDELGDTSQEVVKNWFRSPVIVGIDPARKSDSTVVTVVWVDWDRPDEMGYYDHRVLNWLELTGDDWEEQYFQIVNFLSNYDVLAIGVDSNGVGDAVAQRIKLLIPRAELIEVSSSLPEQTKRWTHLQSLMQRGQIGWPAHAKTRRLRSWKRFHQQMIDAEKNFKGPHMMVAAPDEAHAHDDFVDSLAIAVSLTQDMVMPTVEVSDGSQFYKRNR